VNPWAYQIPDPAKTPVMCVVGTPRCWREFVYVILLCSPAPVNDADFDDIPDLADILEEADEKKKTRSHLSLVVTESPSSVVPGNFL
jgi:hypothetical protein